MTGIFKRHIKRLTFSSEGSVAVFVGLFLVGALGAGVMVVDYTRASTLQGKLQHAMDTSVGEAARGKTDAQVIALAKAQIAEFLKDGRYASVDDVTFTITRDNGRVTLSGSLPYSPLFGPLYGLVGPAGNLLVASGSSAREDLCKPLAAEKRWIATSGACGTGELGSNTWEREEQRISFCAAGASAPTWSNWEATGATRAEVNTCAAACNPEPAQTDWMNSSQACPSGQIGEITWQAEQRRVSTCAAATGTPSWGSWLPTGTKRNENNTCATACTASTQTQWTKKTGACPSMSTGTLSWEEEETRSSTCSSETAAPVWSQWSSTGAKRNEAGTCKPIAGDKLFRNPGTESFTVPTGVTEISIMAIGGGASGYTLHGENATTYRGYPGGISSVTGPGFVLSANGGAGGVGGCGGSKQGGGCGGNGGTSTAYTCQVHPVCTNPYTATCQNAPGPVVAGGAGGAAGGPKGRGGDGSATGIANLGQNGAGAGGTIGTPQTSGGVYSCSRTCLAGSSTGLQSKYGQTVPGEAPGTVFGHSFGYYFDGKTGNNIKTKRFNLEGNCGDGADEDYFFGGGGGGPPGVVAVKQANGKYVLTQTPGLGGGGGELSYGTYAVTPGSKLTVVVGAGGALDDRNAVKKNSFDSAWRNNTLDAYINGTSEIGDGDNGGVWIIWGPGRSFPDNVNVP